jgi:hypothetical protein
MAAKTTKDDARIVPTVEQKELEADRIRGILRAGQASSSPPAPTATRTSRA